MPLPSILPSYAMNAAFKKKNVAGCNVIYELPPVVFLLVKIFSNKMCQFLPASHYCVTLLVCLLAF